MKVLNSVVIKETKIIKPYRNVIIRVGIFLLVLLYICFGLQGLTRRSPLGYIPKYEKIDLSNILNQKYFTEDDYKNIFMQTGLGKGAVDYLMKQSSNGKTRILEYQEAFFEPQSIDCVSIIDGFTYEDHLKDKSGEYVAGSSFVNVLPGDIVVTLSTHSVGWNHGHAGLVLDENTVLESFSLGTKTAVSDISDWNRYSNYAILRVKGISDKTIEGTVKFAKNNLINVPYSLTAGLFGNKFQPVDIKNLGMQCAYLVWYAWMNSGIDLDSDGGKLVTPKDLLFSSNLEVVQMYGMNSELFMVG